MTPCAACPFLMKVPLLETEEWNEADAAEWFAAGKRPWTCHDTGHKVRCAGNEQFRASSPAVQAKWAEKIAAWAAECAGLDSGLILETIWQGKT